MKKILIVNVNWLGDVVFSTPVFKALRKAYPDAHIACLAVKRVHVILEHCSDIDEIIELPEKNVSALMKLIFILARKKFDTCFLLHKSLTRAAIVFFAGIPVRVGYPHKSRAFLTHSASAIDDTKAHRSDVYLNVIESFGVDVNDRRCCLEVSEQALQHAQCILTEKGLKEGEAFVVVNTGGNWHLKQWPADYFTSLVQQLLDRNVRVVLSGAAKDALRVNNIAQESKVNPIVVAGETNLEELLGIFAKAKAVISNDSGPLHLAAALSTPTIGMFGPTRNETTGPRGSGQTQVLFHDVGCNKTACYYLKCRDNVCMQAIDVKEVVAAYEAIVG